MGRRSPNSKRELDRDMRRRKRHRHKSNLNKGTSTVEPVPQPEPVPEREAAPANVIDFPVQAPPPSPPEPDRRLFRRWGTSQIWEDIMAHCRQLTRELHDQSRREAELQRRLKAERRTPRQT